MLNLEYAIMDRLRLCLPNPKSKCHYIRNILKRSPKTNLVFRQNPNHGHLPNPDQSTNFKKLECEAFALKHLELHWTL